MHVAQLEVQTRSYYKVWDLKKIKNKTTEDSFTIGGVFKAIKYSGGPLSPGWKL